MLYDYWRNQHPLGLPYTTATATEAAQWDSSLHVGTSGCNGFTAVAANLEVLNHYS